MNLDPFSLSAYDYNLPEELIAQSPASQRDQSRLLVYQRETRETNIQNFSDLPLYLKNGDLLVLNNSKVYPARIFGKKSHSGTPFEFLLTQHIEGNQWYSIAKNSRRIKPGYIFEFPEDVRALILPSTQPELLQLEFQNIDVSQFQIWLAKYGEIPYPPYITARDTSQERYQTIFSQEYGSIAAPTAGLHFTEAVFEKLKEKNISWLYLTLHIGMGTFAPVRSENIKEHQMHWEYYELSSDNAEKLNQQREQGKRIISVGTTTTRVLETIYRKYGYFKGEKDKTNLFIYPGQEIQAIDGLLTNFHLPKSTLLMLVSTWIGREALFKLYSEAIERKFRFYSFGDAMLLL